MLWPAQNWADVWLGVGCTNFSFAASSCFLATDLGPQKLKFVHPTPIFARHKNGISSSQLPAAILHGPGTLSRCSPFSDRNVHGRTENSRLPSPHATPRSLYLSARQALAAPSVVLAVVGMALAMHGVA